MPPINTRGGLTGLEGNLMDQITELRLANLRGAPRCLAKTRRGTYCERPALRGRRRCRLHGGVGDGAPRGSQNGNYKHGDYTIEAIAERHWARSLARSRNAKEDQC